ncbi:hypothetical protein Veis_3099 [Verminephrobacter eiseniae EF01-2]|uniref:Uncharacterized protein n=1 Tax=Verminephrobacter eiseniae (strain EF01-2) TaxID=391735 RepID=A1WMH5_VEREI|nr:hypothetical protein Veis_3099 [Verminephrobacter eiseniae EF01-2]
MPRIGAPAPVRVEFKYRGILLGSDSRVTDDVTKVPREIPVRLVGDLVLIPKEHHPMLEQHLVDKVDCLLRHIVLNDDTAQFGAKPAR